MRDFDYVAPATLDGAIAALEKHGERARILAGGTDIIVELREGRRDVDVVVDIKRIHDLTGIDFRPDGSLRLGAAVPFHRIWRDDRIVEAYPALTDAARIVGGWQIQGRASTGGNVCNSSPAADTIPALIVERAVCHIAGPGGTRTVDASAFCTGPGRNVLERGELLVAFELPGATKGAGSRYLRFIPRNEMDIAVVGVGAWLQVDGDTVTDARLALAAVAPTAVEATEAASFLVGRPATPSSFEEAGALAREIANPISDMRGPEEYRRHLVGVLVKRALTGALERAQGGDRSPKTTAG